VRTSDVIFGDRFMGDRQGGDKVDFQISGIKWMNGDTIPSGS
jgi:hypothetical protein